jgi:hypothetical protein
MREILRAIFPAVHKHPQKFPHEWSQPFDPATSELRDDEHGCGPVREMKLVLDFQQSGHKRITIN